MDPIPTFDEYNLREKLEAAEAELVRLIKNREQMEWRIHKLQNDIVHLAALCNVEVEDPIKQLGLTDAIRWIFAREKDRPLDVQQVTDVLKKSYTEAAAYKNLSANVHTIVRRLLKAGEIKPFTGVPTTPFPLGRIGDDKESYVWGGGLPPPPPRDFTARAPERSTKPWKPPTSLK